MSEHEEEENPIFEDVQFSTDDLTFAEPGEEPTLPADSSAEAEEQEFGDAGELVESAVGAEGVADEEAVETEEAAGEVEQDEETEEGEEATPEKKGKNLLVYVEWAVVALVCILMYPVFNLLSVPYAIWNAAFAVVVFALAYAVYKTRKIWAEFEVSAFYTIALAGALLALTIGVYCMGLEMSTYSWDLKAEQGKKAQAAAAQSTRPAPAHPLPGKAS
jgi:hypothetical protein